MLDLEEIWEREVIRRSWWEPIFDDEGEHSKCTFCFKIGPPIQDEVELPWRLYTSKDHESNCPVPRAFKLWRRDTGSMLRELTKLKEPNE